MMEAWIEYQSRSDRQNCGIRTVDGKEAAETVGYVFRAVYTGSAVKRGITLPMTGQRLLYYRQQLMQRMFQI